MPNFVRRLGSNLHELQPGRISKGRIGEAYQYIYIYIYIYIPNHKSLMGPIGPKPAGCRPAGRRRRRAYGGGQPAASGELAN